MIGPIARIVLRIVVGFLVGKAFLTPEDGNIIASDPDLAAMLEIGLAVVIGAVTEGWYVLAKKFGWNT